MANYDIIGDIAIVKFKDFNDEQKLTFSKNFLEEHKNVKTVLEKLDKVKGRLRTIDTKFILGNNKKETLHKENNCGFKLNVDTCYFSPRLANERLEVAKLISKYSNLKSKVLVMFSGVAPFSVVLAKNAKLSKIFSIELGKDCNKYAKQNIILNHVQDKIELFQGDVKKVIGKLVKIKKMNK